MEQRGNKEAFASDEFQRVSDERLFRLLLACLDLTLGSLWMVDEEVWKSKLRPYDQNSTRKDHPGLSLRETPPASPYESIPMLHGSSGRYGPVKARLHDPNKPSGHITAFGSLRPARMEQRIFLGRLRQYPYKSHLDDAEMATLTRWIGRMKSRGFLNG